ncbi:MAG: leucyl/phenylalanyl-tRNA--protein transferase, partial [Verrucomicrobia bacterium]|nr:leucyl/phenylalanyl-tRNA--protein transferase [Verrucomicrobiota bacterium]
SSAALMFAAQTLRDEGCRLFDLQMVTPHTARFGAAEISRKEYLHLLRESLREPKR